MGLKLAIKAFFKALKDPKKAESFLAEDKKIISSPDPSHLRLLAMLQQSGRLIDFLKEDIASFSDAQVGAAVRKIHQDCAALLEEFVTVRPVVEQAEGSMIQIPKGYQTSMFKIVGNVKGEPPYSGVLVHRGWKVHKRSLPKNVNEQQSEVIYPAEVELKDK